MCAAPEGSACAGSCHFGRAGRDAERLRLLMFSPVRRRWADRDVVSARPEVPHANRVDRVSTIERGGAPHNTAAAPPTGGACAPRAVASALDVGAPSPRRAAAPAQRDRRAPEGEGAPPRGAGAAPATGASTTQGGAPAPQGGPCPPWTAQSAGEAGASPTCRGGRAPVTVAPPSPLVSARTTGLKQRTRRLRPTLPVLA